MILEPGSIADGEELECDVCIVGAGAAGLSIAREFAHTSLTVVLLESGTHAVDDAYEALNEGEVHGAPFLGLRAGRRRGLGGTTAAWGGQCCELDADDFAARAWVPGSGWPIEREDLVPFYRRAEQLFGVAGERYDELNWLRFGLEPVKLNRTSLRTSFSVFSPRPRIGRYYRKLVSDARNIRVILGATATNIRTNEVASRVTHVAFGMLDGRRARVVARAYVLCAGTIESARLLLSSRDTVACGLGNDNDQVGRYLQDHPTSDTATILPSDTAKLQDVYGVFYRGKTWYWPKLALSAERQRTEKALNASAFLSFQYESSAIEVLRQMVRTTRTGGRFQYSGARIGKLLLGAPAVLDAAYRRYVLGRSPRARPSAIDLTCSVEQAPNPESRVTLSHSRDRFGLPLPRIDWRISDAERHTFRTMTASVSQEFRRLGLGRVVAREWLQTDDPSAWTVWDNYHQTGTTRMSADRTRGVVDVNCQVHGTPGLFVSGAPTFPTSGYANPVLTIAAMSIRLSDHLKRSVLAAC